jgi:phosphosulfolactate phosphohydrolase-like enzyme
MAAATTLLRVGLTAAAAEEQTNAVKDVVISGGEHTTGVEDAAAARYTARYTMNMLCPSSEHGFC